MLQKKSKPSDTSDILVLPYNVFRVFFHLPFLLQNFQNEGINTDRACCLQYKSWLLGRTQEKRDLFVLEALKAIQTFWITSLEAVCHLFQLMPFAHRKPVFYKAPWNIYTFLLPDTVITHFQLTHKTRGEGKAKELSDKYIVPQPN